MNQRELEAPALCPPGFVSVNNLAVAAHTRYALFSRIEDLKEMITYYREALTLCLLGHPRRFSYLHNTTLAVHVIVAMCIVVRWRISKK
jgi:hypothetical protein